MSLQKDINNTRKILHIFKSIREIEIRNVETKWIINIILAFMQACVIL